MRPSGEPDWCEYRCVVPLTGREPVLERIKERLRQRGPGWGWITVAGPRGAGVTRMLDEVEALLRAGGRPLALRVRPVVDATVPMESLREALRPIFPARTPRALERALAAVLPTAPDDLRVLASWLLGGEGAWRHGGLERDLVRELLARTSGGGPVLVDDAERLDDDSLDVLLHGAQGDGPGIVAGVLDSSPLASGGEVLTLEPLGASQIELLLTRWLRHAATARRLAPRLLAHCEGWPGRVVEAVRTLARDGYLRMERRGVVVTSQPEAWPDGRRSRGVFRTWARAQGGKVRRILELASVQDAPDDPALLAEAVGAPTAVVQGVLAEAAAIRGGQGHGRIFRSANAREAYRRSLTPLRRQRLADQLVRAWEMRATPPRSAGAAYGRLRSYTRARRDDKLIACLGAVLVHCREPRRLGSHELDALTEAALRLARSPQPDAHGRLGATLDRLWRAGRCEATARIADAWVSPTAPSTLHEALTRARHAIHRGRPFDGQALLEEHLPGLTPPTPAAPAFDGWILLARLLLIGRRMDAARGALCCAGRSLPDGDLRRRAAWHVALASLARLTRRPRAVRSHLFRSAYLQVAAGDVPAAADGLRELGTFDVEAGRVANGLRALERAAHLHRLLADLEGRARALYEIGFVLARHGAFDKAAHRLKAALAAAEAGRSATLLPRLHLALAGAHHGCGDLLRERHHAELAASLATDALDRVRAANVLAQADLRAGQPAAERLLEACERDLRGAGLAEEAGRAQAALIDARLRAGSPSSAARALRADAVEPHARLGAARLALADDRPMEARRALEMLAGDASVPADVRAAACAFLAESHVRMGRMRKARQAAVSAAALLEVPHRSRAEDARLHRILARVFRRIGDQGRAVGHRRAARRGMRALIGVESDARARRRLIRALWRKDPRPEAAPFKAAS